MSDNAIIVDGLYKSYEIESMLTTDFRQGIGKIFKRKSKEVFWALKDISFELKKGEVLGVIGANGAGKSTLLKILSKITYPTKGKIVLEGHASSLLEVGTGFHPELTGRQNIFLNGALLGMSSSEIRAKFDEIVDFSGVENFIDTPVKKYSSGMYVRLAFAVAAHLETEILLVDEVLAVGDYAFQKKCLGKIKKISKNDGKSILFVSHDMGAIRQLCKKALLLNGSENKYIGDVECALKTYIEIGSRKNDRNLPLKCRRGLDYMTINDIQLHSNGKSINIFNIGDNIEVILTYKLNVKIENVLFKLIISDAYGKKLTVLNSKISDSEFHLGDGLGYAKCCIKNFCLNKGIYYCTIMVKQLGLEIFVYDNAFEIEIVSSHYYKTNLLPGEASPLILDYNWIVGN